MSIDTSRTQLGAAQQSVPPLTSTTPSAATPAKAPPQPAVPVANPPTESDLMKIADELANNLREYGAQSLAWIVNMGIILDHYQSTLPHGGMTTIFRSGRLPVGQRYGQYLAQIGRNKAFRTVSMMQFLPQHVACLAALAPLDARLIEEGVRNGTIHRRLSKTACQALARKLRAQAQPVNQAPAVTLI